MANNTDEIPDDSIELPVDFDDGVEGEKADEDNEVVLTPPPVILTPPPTNNVKTADPACIFNEKMLQKLLQKHFKDDKTKMSQDALKLFAELLRVYSAEIIARAGEQALKEESSSVTLEQLEKVLPQFLLDFN